MTYHPGEFTSNTPGSNIYIILNRNQTLQGYRSTELGLGAPAVCEHKTQIILTHPNITSLMSSIPLAGGACSALAQLL